MTRNASKIPRTRSITKTLYIYVYIYIYIQRNSTSCSACMHIQHQRLKIYMHDLCSTNSPQHQHFSIYTASLYHIFMHLSTLQNSSYANPNLHPYTSPAYQLCSTPQQLQCRLTKMIRKSDTIATPHCSSLLLLTAQGPRNH